MRVYSSCMCFLRIPWICVQVINKPCVREARLMHLISWTHHRGSEQSCPRSTTHTHFYSWSLSTTRTCSDISAGLNSPVLTHHHLNALPSSCRTNLLYRRTASMQLLCMHYNSSTFAPFYLYILLLHYYIISILMYIS